jgi:SNF2 family DNA or RNA helicase
MQLTDHHATYFAYELTRRWPPDSIEKLTEALVDAQVDLNPHQIDAALFAFRSPLSKGAVLADEVGLGKTIEAGPSPVAESVVRCLMPKIRWTGKGIA